MNALSDERWCIFLVQANIMLSCNDSETSLEIRESFISLAKSKITSFTIFSFNLSKIDLFYEDTVAQKG